MGNRSRSILRAAIRLTAVKTSSEKTQLIHAPRLPDKAIAKYERIAITAHIHRSQAVREPQKAKASANGATASRNPAK